MRLAVMGTMTHEAEAPNSKLQAPEKFQASNFKKTVGGYWNFELGISLDVGGWCLELFPKTRRRAEFHYSPSALTNERA